MSSTVARIWIPLCLTLLLQASTAAAWGPAVHVREAIVLAEMMSNEDEGWADALGQPLAPVYLGLGAISPDFQWAIDELSFGHAKILSYALLEAAEVADRDEYRAFALGHLAHILSDANAETFFCPTFFASAPLGMFDLFVGENDPAGESETICEHLGDLVLGVWHPIVDILFDFRLAGDEARARLAEVIAWYCETGDALYGRDSDCAAVVTGLDTLLANADGLLGSRTREEAYEFMDALIGEQRPSIMISVFLSGAVASLTGGQYSISDSIAHFQTVLENSAIATEQQWALYGDAFSDLGPTLAFEHYWQEEPRNTGWPNYNNNALICGNVQSVMQYLPDTYARRPELRADEVIWRQDMAGPTVTSLDRVAADGQPFEVVIRLFASMPFEGTVRGVVRVDRPGFDPSDDTVVGEAEVEMAVDPHDYTTQERTRLVVPFEAATESALGFYLELYADDDPTPWLTTSWDQLWQIEEIDFSYSVYRDLFGTYGHWPPSLAIADPDAVGTDLFVRAHVWPEGPAISEVSITLETEGESPVVSASSQGGMVVFDFLPAAEYTLSGEHTSYVPSEAVIVSLEGEPQLFAAVALEATPALVAPAYVGDRCVPFGVNADDFGGEPSRYYAWLEGSDEEPLHDPIWPTFEDSLSRVCLDEAPEDGSVVHVGLRAGYGDYLGVVGRSEAVVIDTSGPTIEVTVTLLDDTPTCNPVEGSNPPFQVSGTFVEPHSPVMSVGYRVGADSEWLMAGFSFDDEAGTGTFSFDVEAGANAGSRLDVMVENGAGIVGLGSVEAIPSVPLGTDCAGDEVADPADDAGSNDTGGEADMGGTDTGDGPDAGNTDMGLAETGSGAGQSEPSDELADDAGCACSTRSTPGRAAWWIGLLALLWGASRLRRLGPAGRGCRKSGIQ